MIERRWGRIVNFSMANADQMVAQPQITAHYIAKSGILTLTRTLAKVLGRHNVTVNAISPGNTATPLNQHLQDNAGFVKMLESFTPTNRAYISTEEIAGAAVFLASDDARAVHGLDLIVDDGWCAI